MLNAFPRNNLLTGYLLGIGYTCSLSASTIWLNQLGKNFPLTIMLFYSALISTILINAINYKQIITCHKTIFKDKGNWFLMSLSMVFVWYFAYYSTIYSSAEFYISIVFLVTAFLSSISIKNYFKAAACLVSLTLCYHLIVSANIPALLAAIVAGIATYVYYKLSYQFSEKNKITAIGILSIRFYFVLIIVGLMALFQDDIITYSLSAEQLAILTLLSIVNMVIPMILSQSSFQKIGVSRFTFLTSLIPALTFTIEFILQREVSVNLIFLCIVLTLTLNADKVTFRTN